MDKLIIIHSIKQFKLYNKIDKNFLENPSIKILAFTIEIRLYLQSMNIPYLIQEQFMDEETIVKIDECAMYYADIWHNNSLKFVGLPLGSRFHTFISFSKIITSLHVFLKIIESEKPLEIIIIEDRNEDIITINYVLQHICSIKNIHLKVLSKKKPTSSFIYEDIQTRNKNNKSIFLLIGESYVYKYFLRVLFNIIWKLQDFNWKFSKHTKKTILIPGRYYYHGSIVQKLSNIHRLVLFDFRPQILRKKDLLFLFSKKREGSWRFLDLHHDKKMEKQVNIFLKKSFKEWNKILESPKFKEIFTYNGISFWPILKKTLPYILLNYKLYIIRFLINYKILKRNKYDLLILEQDFKPTNKTLSYIASKMNIPSLIIQHGFTGHYSAIIPTYCTKLAVWGKVSRDYLNQHGLGNNKMVITGTPRYDEYFKMKKDQKLRIKIKDSVYKHFNIDKSRKLYVLAGIFGHFYNYSSSYSYNHLEYERFLKMTFKAIKKLSNSHLIVKLRNLEPHSEIPLRIKEALDLPNLSIVTDYKMIDLIVACDCLITGYSSTGIEAMILEKPIIIINFRKSTETIPFNDYNAVFSVSNFEDLLNAMEQSLIKPVPVENYNKFLKDYIYKTDELSTNRVFNLINNLLNV
ncbi:MAG: CDP-glycerol glycerophosphotransferase family protein [Promethearchaeota archaeon]